MRSSRGPRGRARSKEIQPPVAAHPAPAAQVVVRARRALSDCLMQEEARNVARACEIHFQLLPWMRAAFIESNPLPAKAAQAHMSQFAKIVNARLADERESQSVPPEAAGARQALDHDADVMDLLDHALSHPTPGGRTMPVRRRRTNLAEPRGDFKRFPPARPFTPARRASGIPPRARATRRTGARPLRRGRRSSYPRAPCPRRAWSARTAAPAARRCRARGTHRGSPAAAACCRSGRVVAMATAV